MHGLHRNKRMSQNVIIPQDMDYGNYANRNMMYEKFILRHSALIIRALRCTDGSHG